MVDLINVKQTAAKQDVKFTSYQKKLLEEINKNPELVKLFKVIFKDYAQILRKEMSQRNPNASRRQQQAGIKTTETRLKIESYIEACICKLSGINLETLQGESEKSEKEDK